MMDVPLRCLRFWLCGGCGKIYWEGKMFVKAGPTQNMQFEY